MRLASRLSRVAAAAAAEIINIESSFWQVAPRRRRRHGRRKPVAGGTCAGAARVSRQVDRNKRSEQQQGAHIAAWRHQPRAAATAVNRSAACAGCWPSRRTTSTTTRRCDVCNATRTTTRRRNGSLALMLYAHSCIANVFLGRRDHATRHEPMFPPCAMTNVLVVLHFESGPTATVLSSSTRLAAASACGQRFIRVARLSVMWISQ